MLALTKASKARSRVPTITLLLSAVAALQAFAADPKFTVVDLSAQVQKRWSDIPPGTSWAAVPRGLQTINTVPFKLDGLLEVTGMGSARAGEFRPAQITGIPARGKATHIHILHGTGYDAPDGTPIAALTLNFSNGESRSIPISYGTHVRNWWVERSEATGTVTDPNSEIAWVGSSPETDQRGVTLRLYRSRFVNPLPDQEIRTIDFSSLFSRATPVMLGLSLEHSSPGDLKVAQEMAMKAMEQLATLRQNVLVELNLTGPDPRFEGARVRLEVEEGGRTMDLGSFKSDPAGKVRLYFPPDSESLTWIAEGPYFVAARGHLSLADIKPDEPVRVELKRGTLLGGKVQTPGGQPIAGAKVALSVATPEESGEIGEVETDASGNWRTGSVPSDYTALDFTVSHPDYRTSDYAQNDEPSPQSVSKNDLLERKAVFVLKPTPAVTGTVKDAQGKPIADAQITLRLDARRVLHSSSDKSGAFRVGAVEGEEADLIVEAASHAPFHKQLSLGEDNVITEVVLEEGQALSGRVLEAEDTAVEKVEVSVQSWNGLPGLNWRTETDSEGRFLWKNAPSGPVVLSFSKPGYQKQNATLSVSATDEEIKLEKAFKLAGKVIDAETKEPIETFRIIPGQVWGGQDDAVRWERSGAVTGKDGQYVLDKIEHHGGELRYLITAEGYQPVASPAYPPAGWHAFDAELKKAKRPEGVIKNKDGEPVEKVAIATLGNGYLMLSRGSFRTYDRSRPYIFSDSEGRFRLEEALDTAKIVFVHEKFGYAESTMGALRTASEVTLQPWAKIEGQLKIGSTNSGPGKEVMLVPRRNGPGDLAFDYDSYKQTTGTDGKFTIDFVPPGERQLIRLIPILRGAGWSHYTRFTIEPGETKKIVIGGVGRPIIGKLATSDPARQVNWRSGHHALSTPYPKPPSRFTSSEEARAWQRSPEVQEAQRSHRSYTLEVSDDGSFVISDVIPGAYTLNVHLTEPTADGNFGGEFLGSASKDVVVEEIPGGQTDEPIALGTITIPLKADLKVGMAAPEIEAKTLEELPFNLKDLSGKYILLDFWATWCGPCVAEVPNLKAAFEKHGNNPAFVMVGLSLDAGLKEPREFVKKKNLPWIQVFLGEWSKTSIPNTYGVTGIPATFLIDPDGKIIERGLRGEDILPALDKHLPKTAAAR